MALTATHSTEPVTSLHITGGHIIAGVGSCLRVYEVKTGSCVHQSILLPCCKIHGIKAENENPESLAVYGGKSVRVVVLNHEEARYLVEPQTPVRQFEDWVWNLCWLSQDDENRSCIALVLGHNVILKWDWSTDIILHRVDCEEKCILYSATFIGNVWENLVLAAGTVFNQVVLWSPCGKKSENDCSKVIYRLRGHQGVIFSIDYNTTQRLICSVSDDRSIRIWKLNFPPREGLTEHVSIVDWEGVESELLHVLYGHEARVWDVRILSNYFVSIGEDATCCIWDHCGHVTKKFRGHKGKSIWSLAVNDDETFVVTGGGDTSIRVWYLTAVDDLQHQMSQQTLQLPQEDDFARSVTLQGYDNILVITDNGVLYKYCVSSSEWQTLMSATTFRSYTIMSLSSDGSTIALGNISGELRLIHQTTGNSVDRKVLYLVHSKQLYSQGQRIFSIVWLSDSCILTTGAEGSIIVWALKLSSSEVSLSRVRSFVLPPCKQHWVSAAAFLPEDEALVCGDRGGTVHLYHLKQDDNGPSQSFAKIHGKAGVTDVCCHGDYVYTAGRDGQYRIYTYQGGQLCLLNNNRVFKGFEWIAKMKFTDENDLHIYGFHTSNFVLWSINQNQKLIEIPCGGGHRAWGSHLSPRRDRFQFVYLKAKDICLYTSKLTTNHVILKPGLHGRKISSVKYIASCVSDSGSPVHVFATASEDTSVIISALLYNSSGIPEHVPLETLQGHISSVMTLSVCKHTPNDTGVNVVIFSGGGRAEIRAWSLELLKSCDKQSNCRSSVCCCMQSGFVNSGSEQNISTVEHCDKCKQTKSCDLQRDNKTLDSCNEMHLGQHGEFCDRNKVTIVQNSAFGIEDRPDLKDLPDMSKMCVVQNLGGYMLCQKHRTKKYKPWKEHLARPEPETRFLDLSAFPANEIMEDILNIYFVVAACSDGFLRLFAFDRNEKDFSLIKESSYHSNCVLKVDHIIHRTEGSVHVIILSAATDGNIAVWDLTDLCLQTLRYYQRESDDSSDGSESDRTSDHSDILPKETIKAHQSGINSIHTLKVESGHYFVVSGGDDNSISIWDLFVERRGVADISRLSLSVQKYAEKISPHAAQVTGVYLLSTELLLSTSIDQRVCLWKLKKDRSQPQIVMLACQTVTVADISEMDVWNNIEKHVVVVCGEGIATLEVVDLTNS